jgi:effector-binding domain-containing protein
MKKKLAIVFILISLVIASLYIFIPNIVTLKCDTTIPVSQKGLHRMLLDNKNIAKWWPGDISNDSFFLNSFSYKISDNNVSLLPILIENKEVSINSSLLLISLQTGLVKLEWVGKTITSYNPIKRFFAYRRAKQVNDAMNIILQKMLVHFSKPEHIYGSDIQKVLVVDAILISTEGECKGYPSTAFIYSLINKLTDYANSEKVQITGYPMLNIQQTDSINYHIQVALPLEKTLASKGDILQKQMVKDGNILVAEVKGGIIQASAAFDQIIQYAKDYDKNMPAIPFYSLITDRSKETDSTKWITKVYCPVM